MTSDGTKIALAIVAAAVIVVAGVVGYFEYTKWQIATAAESAVEALRKESADAAMDKATRAHADQVAERRAQQSRWLRRPERCIGGKVMVPAPAGQAGWVMQLERGQPVRCGGMDSPKPYRLNPRPLAEQ